MKNDVLAAELTLACLPFDRPALLKTEAERVGLLAFSVSYGYGGMSLAGWVEMRARAQKLTSEAQLPFFGLDEDTFVSLSTRRFR